MKLILPLFFLALISCDQPERISPLWGDPIKIDPTKPPDGMHMVQILLENQLLPVKGTGCEGSALGSGDKRLLQHSLALMLGSSIDPGTMEFKLSGGCKVDQIETKKGPRIDIWRCNLGISNIETSTTTTTVSADIYFGITKDTWEFIPEKLLCL